MRASKKSGKLDIVELSKVDVVSYTKTPALFRKFCRECTAIAQELLEKVKSLSSSKDEDLTWENVMERVDQISYATNIILYICMLSDEVHPDFKIRAVAQDCMNRCVSWNDKLYKDKQFTSVIVRFSKLFSSDDYAKTKMLQKFLVDMRNNGVYLKGKGRTRFTQLNNELAQINQEFESNVNKKTLSIDVRPDQLKGLSEQFIEQHKTNKSGYVSITTDYPDYFSIVMYAEDRTVTRDLTEKFNNRGWPENAKLLDRLLSIRQNVAQLLGYTNWAEYSLHGKLAKSVDEINEFIETIYSKMSDVSVEDLKKYEQFHKGMQRIDDMIPSYDIRYLNKIISDSEFHLDSKKLSEYFEIESVISGVIGICEFLYDIEFHEVKDASVWHKSVKAYDIRSCNDGSIVSRVYLDLYPRPKKYKHMCLQQLRDGKLMSDGSYSMPMSVLIGNFPKATKSSPSLLMYEDVLTMFHEFGHMMHHALTRHPLGTLSGFATSHEFVEVPSQMFEEWGKQRCSLDTFARHYITGEKIPDEMFEALQKSRRVGMAFETLRQIGLSVVDMKFHTLDCPFDADVVFKETMKKYRNLGILQTSHEQCSFTHLIDYSAGYYGYLWANSIVHDVLSKFTENGLMSKKIAYEWKSLVLESGGCDELSAIEKFLGRSTTVDAYMRFLSNS